MLGRQSEALDDGEGKLLAGILFEFPDRFVAAAGVRVSVFA
jgi:hypothetical protein